MFLTSLKFCNIAFLKVSLYPAGISTRERTYLWYRFGFPDEPQNKTIKDTASHFHLSESRAKSTEAAALDNIRLELPWWYD